MSDDVAPAREVIGGKREKDEEGDRHHGHRHLPREESAADGLDALCRARLRRRAGDGVGRLVFHRWRGCHGYTVPDVRRLTTSCLLVSALVRSAIFVPCRRMMIRSARSNTVSRLWLMREDRVLLLAHGPDEIHHARGLAHAECCGRLVEQRDHPALEPGTRNGHSLALTARERADLGAHIRQADPQALDGHARLAHHALTVDHEHVASRLLATGTCCWPRRAG